MNNKNRFDFTDDQLADLRVAVSCAIRHIDYSKKFKDLLKILWRKD